MAKDKSSDSLIPPAWILAIIAIVTSFWLLFQLKEILVLLVLGYSVAYGIDPLLESLQKRGISRSVGVFAVFGVGLIVACLLVFTALPTILREYDNLSSNMPGYLGTVKDKLIPLYGKAKQYLPAHFQAAAGNGSDSATILDSIPTLGSDLLPKLSAAMFSALLGGYSLTLTVINFALLPIIVFYLAVDFRQIHRRALTFVPVPQRKNVTQIALEIDGYVAAFVRGQFLVGCILFVLYLVGLGAIVGIKLWFLLAVISGFGNLVPYLGFLCGIVLSSIMALVTFGDFWHVLEVWMVYGAVQFLEGFIITPKVVGKSVGLSPLAIILAIFAGGQIFGLLGVFLAVPGAAALRVLFNHTHAFALKRWA